MTENTFTYTARSAIDPDKMATFTLHNGHVSLAFGNAIMQQVEQAYDALHDDEANRFKALIRPVATGSLQRLTQPIPIKDFRAEVEDDGLHTLAWIRAGGLRLAPMVINWRHVDNPQGAHVFAKEVATRREQQVEAAQAFNPFDYWAGWALIGVLFMLLPIFLRQLRSNDQDTETQ